MSDKLPSIDDFYEELPSIDEIIKEEKELPSVDEFVEKEEVIEEPTKPMPMQVTYDELRARLPREVSDEVIRLLASSEQALLDFAQIQTQDDIARFNQKYNADLVLPSQNQAV